MKDLPDQLINRYISMYGENGKVWLQNFSNLRDQIRQRWSLEDPDPVSFLSYNYLEYARDATGRQVVLKIGYPHNELKTEILALKYFNGKGAVKIIESDPERGTLLLERIVPGYDLRSLQDDDEGIRIACQVMTNLWKLPPKSSQFPTMDSWCQGFQRYQDHYSGTQGPLPKENVQKAGSIAEALLKDDYDRLLLHGDLHHMNILRGKNGSWLAIDPKGVIGEPAFEMAPLLFNPIEEMEETAELDTILKRRINIVVHETGLDIDKILQWSYVRGMLSAIWDIEDGGNNWSFWIKMAQALADIMDS